MPSSQRLLIAAQPLHGGVAEHVVGLVRALPTEEYKVDVACPRESSIWQRLEGLDGVALHRIRPHREPAVADALTLATLLPLVRRAGVVHGHSSKAGFLVRLASLLTSGRKRCIFTPHGWSFWAGRGMEARLYLGLERTAARWCRSIVALSDAERAAGLEAGVGRDEQYRVIVNGIDVERFGLEPRPAPDRIVTIGRLAPPKRPDLLLRAFALLRRRRPRAELHIVGEGPARADVERQIRELGLGESVRLLGHRDDVAEILAGAACFVLASDYEGCPLAVIEAMAAAVPVVATGVGGVSELVEDGRSGLVLPADNVLPLAEAMESVLSNPDRARRMGEAGRAIARSRLSRDRMVGDLLRLYEEARAG